MTVLFLLSFNRISIQISDLHWHSTEGRGGVRSSGCGSVWSVGPNKHKVHMSNAFWFHVEGQFYRINRSALIDSFLTWGLTSRHEDKLTVTESPGMFFDNFWTHTADEAQFLISPDKFTFVHSENSFQIWMRSEWGIRQRDDVSVQLSFVRRNLIWFNTYMTGVSARCTWFDRSHGLKTKPSCRRTLNSTSSTEVIPPCGMCGRKTAAASR